MQRWIERPEARWALRAGVAGALAMTGVSTVMILSQPEPAAVAAAVAMPALLAYELWSRFAPR